ncbi:MAG: Gfo/Idh/MocA family protein [Tepidisphaeraceae bacterium]
MPATLGFGILGTGNIANQFAMGIATSVRTRTVAVGSRSVDSARAFADRFGIQKVHGSYGSLLSDQEVDAVYLSLPNSMHHEWTIRSLRAGKHVLCEKPLAVTAAQGREMFEEARRAGRTLVEAFMYVSHPQTRAIIDAVRGGTIGELRLIRTSFCYRTTRVDGNIRFDPAMAGGATMDVGCYCVHFSRMVAGAEPDSVHAVSQLHESGVDLTTTGVLHFPAGVVASFVCGMGVQCDNTAHVCGTEGYIEIPWPWKPLKTATYTIAHSAPPRQDKGLTAPSPRREMTITAARGLYALEADDFAAAVLDGAPPALTESNTLGNLRVMDEIRRQIGAKY